MVNFAPFDDVGSGGTIIFNTSSSAFELGHEMGHAYDANFGMLDSREISVNGGYSEIREVRAVYYENMIRAGLAKGFRKNYSDGPSLLDKNKEPIFYQGVLPSILLGLWNI